jgi:hypothetical protein
MIIEVVDIADIKCPLISISGHRWTVGKQAVTVHLIKTLLNRAILEIIGYGKVIQRNTTV